MSMSWQELLDEIIALVVVVGAFVVLLATGDCPEWLRNMLFAIIAYYFSRKTRPDTVRCPYAPDKNGGGKK